MALVEQALKSELTSIYEKGKKGNLSPQMVGVKTGNAYLSYMQNAQNVFGFTFTGMTGAADLGQELGKLYSTVPTMSGEKMAREMSKAFDKCIATLLTTNQTTIVSTAFGPLCYTHLNIAFGKPARTSTDYAKNVAKALHLSTTAPAIILSGIVPGTPPVPFSGPIS